MILEQIDTSTTAGKLIVMAAWDNGRPVAFQRGRIGRFEPLPRDQEPAWDWSSSSYAVIAEPVGPDEVWVTVIDGNVVMDAYATEQEAGAALNRGWKKVKYIRADLAEDVP